MGMSVAELLDERAERDASIREALELYPDLFIDGDYLSTPSLRAEDCDAIVVMPGNPVRLAAGRRIGTIVVMRWGLYRQDVSAWLYGLRERQPELYAQLVRSLGGV